MKSENMHIDPTTYAVCLNTFDNLVEEMGNRITFATQSFVMSQCRDIGQVLLDDQGRIVTVAAYLPCHIFQAGNSVSAIIDKFEGDFKPDDYIVGNDPHIIKSGHLPDWTFVRPAFYKGKLLGFFQVRGHQADTGGFTMGGYSPGAIDIIAEGLNVPPIKLLRAGELNKDAWELIMRNVRNCKQVEMDTFLMNGAMKKAEAGLATLCERYGEDTVRACMSRFIDVGEEAVRREISKMKDGVYFADRFADWDGTTDRPVHVRCKTIISGDEITFDLSESDPQCDFINSPLGNTEMSVLNGLYSMIDPQVPKNYGSMMKAVKVITKPGTCVDPEWPATVGSSAVCLGSNITEVVQICLCEANPNRAIGGSTRHCCPIGLGQDTRVIDPRTGQPNIYWAETFASEGSAGARKGYDGWQGISAWVHIGALGRTEAEFFEGFCPYRITRYEVMQDFEGAGQWRGGPGVEIEVYADVPDEGGHSRLATGNCDGNFEAPWGINGGLDGACLEMYIDRARSGEREVLRTMDLVPIYRGDRYVTMDSGGGGYGDPLDREPSRVLKDYRDRIISQGRAKDIYGVVIDEKTLTIDEEKTKALRAEMKGLKS